MLSSTSRVASRALRSRPSVGSVLTTKRSYHENIVEHYENPRNVGSLDKNESNVGTVRSYFCLLIGCCSLDLYGMMREMVVLQYYERNKHSFTESPQTCLCNIQKKCTNKQKHVFLTHCF